MKKLSLYILLVFIWCNLSVNANAVPKTKSGKGELFLSEKIIEGYYDYVTNNRLPLIFFISEDKQDFYTVIINQDGKGVAGSGYILKKIPKCQTKLKQKCYVFSNSRHIVWDNGINPRKGKKSKISSKIPKEDLIIKLNELGFIETKEQKVAKENKVAEDKATKENKVTEDKAAKEKRIAKEKAAKENKVVEDKTAKEKKITEQKVAEEKLDKKLSLISTETDLEKAQNFLNNLQDFIKLYPDEFDIIKISEFFILTRPVLDGDLNYKSKKDLEQFKEFTNTSDGFVKYNKDIEKEKRVNKLNKINDAVSNLKNNIKIIKGFLVTDPNSIYLEEWLNAVKNAELIIENPSSYDQLLTINEDLIKLTKSKNEIDEITVDLKNNINELKEILKKNLTTDLAPLLLEQAKTLEAVIKKQLLKDMKLANQKFEEFITDKIPKDIKKEKVKKEEVKKEEVKKQSADALWKLGLKYFNGDGVAKDPIKSAELWSTAADKGHAPSQYELGMSYFFGEGVNKDVKKASELLTLAANQGHAMSQLELGISYQYPDQGVKKDLALAYMFLRISIEERPKYNLDSQQRNRAIKERKNLYGVMPTSDYDKGSVWASLCLEQNFKSCELIKFEVVEKNTNQVQKSQFQDCTDVEKYLQNDLYENSNKLGGYKHFYFGMPRADIKKIRNCKSSLNVLDLDEMDGNANSGKKGIIIKGLYKHKVGLVFKDDKVDKIRLIIIEEIRTKENYSFGSSGIEEFEELKKALSKKYKLIIKPSDTSIDQYNNAVISERLNWVFNSSISENLIILSLESVKGADYINYIYTGEVQYLSPDRSKNYLNKIEDKKIKSDDL